MMHLQMLIIGLQCACHLLEIANQPKLAGESRPTSNLVHNEVWIFTLRGYYHIFQL